jgi:outer membrane protein assembly factor BamB/tRNA A-37 threonylcarbamoyl transferase component Bud32
MDEKMDQNLKFRSAPLLLKKGTRLADRYLIQSSICHSATSAVYKARDLHFPNVVKLVAVKEFYNPAPDAQTRQANFETFERQVNLLATLAHPSLPGILDYIIQEKQAYLVSEYIHGKPLSSFLKESPGYLSPEQVIPWAIGICEVLQYLHGHQPEPVFVTEISPTNIMLDQHNQVLLVDSGLAAAIHQEIKDAFAGSTDFIAPEVYKSPVNAVSDIYSLGACLNHLLTGNPLPQQSPMHSIQQTNPEVPDALEAIINKAGHSDPAARYQAAGEMKTDLLGVLGRSESRQLVPQYDSVAPMPENTIQPLWIFECGDEIRGTALYNHGIVYFGSYDHHLYAVDAESGQIAWKYQTDGGIVSRPAIAEKSVFIGSEDSRLHVLSTRSGSLLWTYYTKGPIRSSPFVAHGHVFIGSDDLALHAVNINGGRGIWQIETIGEIRSTPFVTQDEIYAGNESGEFYCADFRGTIKWRYKAKRAITSSAIVANGVVFFCSLDSYIYALDAKSGFLIWRFKMNKGSISSPSVAENLLYTGAIDGNIYCVNTNSAKEVWRFETENQVTGSPIIIEDELYCGSVDGYLYCLDRQTGQLRWKFNTEGPITGTPAAGSDCIYVGSTNKLLFALPTTPAN